MRQETTSPHFIVMVKRLHVCSSARFAGPVVMASDRQCIHMQAFAASLAFDDLPAAKGKCTHAALQAMRRPH